MSVVIAHGKFDYKSNKFSGLEVLATYLRTQGFEVETINCNERFKTAWPDVVIGYSNGADAVVTQLEEEQIPVRLLILLDPVWKSLIKQWFRRPFIIPRHVRLCVTYMRRDRGWPRNSTPNRDEVMVRNLDHADFPSDSQIRRNIVDLVKGERDVDKEVLA